MTPGTRKSLFRLVIFASLLMAFACLRVEGMGYIPHGGLATVGLTLSELTDSKSGPVTPLNSILLDEHHVSVVPLNSRTGFASWEQDEPDMLRLRISPGVVVDRESGFNIDADTISRVWQTRAEQRWDARWALRFIDGLDDGDENTGLEIINSRTLNIHLKQEVNKDVVLASLKTPALRLGFGFGDENFDGAGPFTRWFPSPQRHRFTAMLSHYAGRPYIDEFTVIAYPSAEESVLDFGRGSLDALILTSSELDRYTGSSRAEPERITSLGHGIILLMFNPAMIPNAVERRALSMAVNRESLASVVLGEGASAAIDFMGTAPEAGQINETNSAVRELYSSIPEPKDRLSVLVPDDPAARAAAGRLRANIESLGVPVDLVQDSGELKLSMNADIILVSVRLIDESDGVLPQCLSLWDRNGWWDIAQLALPVEDRQVLNSVRNFEPEADINLLGSALQISGLIVPLVKYEIFFAPGPEIELVSDKVFPGSLFWRIYLNESASADDADIDPADGQ